MVIKPESMRSEKIENMRGGKGEVEILHLLDKELMLGKARLFAKLSVRPGSSVGFHRHDNEFEIFYILSGEGIFNDNGVSKPIRAGDICFTNSGESHSIENVSQKDLEFLAVIVLL